MRKITKTEKQGIAFLLITIIVFAFLTEPITNLVNQAFNSNLIKMLIGLGLIVIIAYLGKLNKVLR